MESSKKFFTDILSPIGILRLLSDGQNLIAIEFENEIDDSKKDLFEDPNLAIFQTTKTWLDNYFTGKKPNPKDIPIKLLGTSFQVAVWERLKDIDYGQTISYGELGQQVAKDLKKKSMAGQAIGGAVGKNPVPIIIPCHRVVGKDGNLTGYSGGMDKKKILLKTEQVDLKKFYLPKKKQESLVKQTTLELFD